VKRVLFRFVFVYLLVYNLPFWLQYLPGAEMVLGEYQKLLHEAGTWVGSHVFGVEITVFTNGSGDTTYDYVVLFCQVVLSAAVAAVWSLLGRGRGNYDRLHHWLRVYVRFSLASAMVLYGSVKVIKSQFPDPSLDRLLQPYGDSSPMGLLWTFMGASASYNVFAGAGEVLGGVLLTTRRTTLLGALVCIGVLSNIVVLNFSYDVPVKLYSSNLLLMAVFLTIPDLGRLVDFFARGRPAAAPQLRRLFANKWLDRVAVSVRTVLVVGLVGLWLYNAYQMRQTFASQAVRSPLYGVWTVEELEDDGKARPPLVTDTTRWRRVVFDYPQTLAVQLMSDTRQRYNLQLDADAHTLALTKREDPKWKTTLGYTQPAPGLLTLEGMLDGHQLRARLRRDEDREFLLTSRGFHWINEYPFNR
jgi:hypothetical protein